MGDFHIDLFCEDLGHEEFFRHLVERIASDQGINARITTRTARGGAGKAVSEFAAYQALIKSGHPRRPDLLVIAIDANCKGWSTKRDEISSKIDTTIFPKVVIACPDPHIERWCFTDPFALAKVVGAEVLTPQQEKCERKYYKQLLRTTIEKAGNTILTSEMEYAPDIVQNMNLHQAGKNCNSLKHCITDIRSAMK